LHKLQTSHLAAPIGKKANKKQASMATPAPQNSTPRSVSAPRHRDTVSSRSNIRHDLLPDEKWEEEDVEDEEEEGEAWRKREEQEGEAWRKRGDANSHSNRSAQRRSPKIREREPRESESPNVREALENNFQRCINDTWNLRLKEKRAAQALVNQCGVELERVARSGFAYLPAVPRSVGNRLFSQMAPHESLEPATLYSVLFSNAYKRLASSIMVAEPPPPRTSKSSANTSLTSAAIGTAPYTLVEDNAHLILEALPEFPDAMNAMNDLIPHLSVSAAKSAREKYFDPLSSALKHELGIQQSFEEEKKAVHEPYGNLRALNATIVAEQYRFLTDSLDQMFILLRKIPVMLQRIYQAWLHNEPFDLADL